jgi:hypothetical protein
MSERHKNVRREHVFISHIADESRLALLIKDHLLRDFRSGISIFVSSDAESIAAGERWMDSIEAALRNAALELILCSTLSIERPWINFEAGAGWFKNIPVIPICHSGLKPSDLPMPLSQLQAVEADECGLRSVYDTIARVLQLPFSASTNFVLLSTEVKQFESEYKRRTERRVKPKRSALVDRLREALEHPKYTWRTLERLASLSGSSEDEVLEILLLDPEIQLSRGKRGKKRIAALKSRIE